MPQPFPAANDAELRTEWPVRCKITAYVVVSNEFFFISHSIHFSLVWFGDKVLLYSWASPELTLPLQT